MESRYVLEQAQLDKIKIWFDDYVKGFYGDDETVNANIELKEKHTRRTCKEILYLADELELDENQRLISETIALLHDIGRFEQLLKYRTYSDARSVDHCLLGLEVLQTNRVLDGIDLQEKLIIQKAIEYHGRKELPAGLDDEYLLFSKLIRDADKLDALNVVTKYYKQYKENPVGFKVCLELPDEPGYSEYVLNELFNERCVDYRQLKTLNDLMLSLLCWVYDMNFTPALKRLMECGYLHELLGFLPQDENMGKVGKKILGYVDFRMKQDGK
ncbi:MAG: HD domain-containing protein [Sedimentisphaerales bacterium]|nr:HD domain-containing protein [Sedimentisphaerales bacterium]